MVYHFYKFFERYSEIYSLPSLKFPNKNYLPNFPLRKNPLPLSLSNTNLPILHFLPFQIFFRKKKDLSIKKKVQSNTEIFLKREEYRKYKILDVNLSNSSYEIAWEEHKNRASGCGSSTKRRTDLVKVWDWRSRLEDPKKHRRRRITPSSPSPPSPRAEDCSTARYREQPKPGPGASNDELCAPALRLNEWFPRGVATLRLHSAPITPTGVARFIVSCSLLLNIAQLCLQRWPNCPDPACVIVLSPEECWNGVREKPEGRVEAWMCPNRENWGEENRNSCINVRKSSICRIVSNK